MSIPLIRNTRRVAAVNSVHIQEIFTEETVLDFSPKKHHQLGRKENFDHGHHSNDLRLVSAIALGLPYCTSWTAKVKGTRSLPRSKRHPKDVVKNNNRPEQIYTLYISLLITEKSHHPCSTNQSLSPRLHGFIIFLS